MTGWWVEEDDRIGTIDNVEALPQNSPTAKKKALRTESFNRAPS